MKFDDMKKLWMAKPGLIFIMILSVIIKLRPILGETRVDCPATLRQARRIQSSICTGKSSLNCPAYNTGPVAGRQETVETDTNLETNNHHRSN